jgi:ABC-type glycerol-3-phosphate transport system substrate-binding protein
VAAGTALAACARCSARPKRRRRSTGAETGPVTLEYWFCWPGIYQEKQRAILDAFEQEMNDQIKINDLTIASNIRDKMLTSVAAGEAPDAAACFGDLNSLAAKGAFMPIDEYVKASTIMKLDALYQPRVEATFWRNAQYGFPYNQRRAHPLNSTSSTRSRLTQRQIRPGRDDGGLQGNREVR